MADDRPVPLDEYPVHQVPLSMKHVATGDRNAYDRCIFHVFDHAGRALLILGLGVYPNLGVIDAYATARRGRTQVAVRASDALGPDRMSQSVGPIRIEVDEPLRRLRAVCEADAQGLAFDLVYDAASEAFEEPRHLMWSGNRVTLDGCRFVQTGRWTGTVSIQGQEFEAGGGAGEAWSGDRDRSWGIRPVGEPETPGRSFRDPAAGIWWCWVPLRFADHTIVVIAQEDVTGRRVLTEAARIWPAGSGRPDEQLGWPRFEITYKPGTRFPDHARIHLTERDGTPLVIDVEPVNHISLNVGCGYGADPEWTHGLWKGEKWVDSSVYDLDDPAVTGRTALSMIDHVARATCNGQEGTGIFEHACLGRHEPSGFEGWESMGYPE